MNTRMGSLLEKEWIKLRRWLWIFPLLLAYAAIDSALVLRTIERTHGSFGLWATLLGKEPDFFRPYLVLAACGVGLAFLQAWPECQGKRLRLLFQMPVEPGRILAVMAGTGLTLLMGLNLAAHGILAGSMAAFHMPRELIVPVLGSVAPWSLLSLALYLATLAFLAARGPLKLLILASALAAVSLLATGAPYGAFGPSLGAYALACLLFVPLTFYAFLGFLDNPAPGAGFVLVRGASLLLGALSLCTLLPPYLARATAPTRSRVLMHYSPTRGRFALQRSSPGREPGPVGTADTRYFLENGEPLNRLQYAEALPILHAEDLLKWKRFPATIAGVPLTPQEAKYAWEYHTFMPRDWNAPLLQLYLMLESEPKGARLEMPTDVFRIRRDGPGLEFLNPADGKILAAKSAAFTEALKDQGFRFPVQALGGNPDVRKEYDYGHLLVDDAGQLFRLQMVDGRPRCLKGPEPIPGKVRAVLVSEHRRREFAGFIVTDHGFFAVLQRDMAVRPLPIEAFRADSTQVTLWADPLVRSLGVQDSAAPLPSIRGIAMTPAFQPLHSHVQSMEPQELRRLKRHRLMTSILFPFQVTDGVPGSSFQRLGIRLADRPAAAFLVSFGLAGGLALLRLRQRRRLPIRHVLMTAAFGPAGLLALALSEWRPTRLMGGS